MDQCYLVSWCKAPLILLNTYIICKTTNGMGNNIKNDVKFWCHRFHQISTICKEQVLGIKTNRLSAPETFAPPSTVLHVPGWFVADFMHPALVFIQAQSPGNKGPFVYCLTDVFFSNLHEYLFGMICESALFWVAFTYLMVLCYLQFILTLAPYLVSLLSSHDMHQNLFKHLSHLMC